MPAKREWLWTDADGVNRWHDHPEPDPRKSKSTEVGFGAKGWATGLSSDSAGVPSRQVGEFREDAQKHGFTGVDFTSDGTAVFSSRAERTRYLKHRGLYDRDAGYGDAAPRNH